MSISRRVARPLLASMFISGGLDAVRNPKGKVKAAEAVTELATDLVPALPQDTETLVRLNGAVQVGAGVLLAVGKFRRLSALVLIGSIIPTTYAGHRFWEETDEEAKKQQQIHFLKNLGLLGGLILAAFDTEGAPSLGWRARRQAHRMTEAVSIGRASTEAHAHRASATAGAAGRKAGRKASKAAGAGRKAGRKANKAATKASHRANSALSDAAKTGLTLAAPYLRHANEGAHEAAKSGVSFASPYVRHANEGAHDAAKSAAAAGRKAGRKANKAATKASHRANGALSDAAKSGLTLAAPYLRHANESAHEAAKTGVSFATPYVRQANEGAHDAAKSALEGAEHLLSVGAERAGDLLSKAADRLPD